MFRNTDSFNQPIGNWNLNNVQFANGMFQNATAFNQNLTAWTFPSRTDSGPFADGSLLAPENFPSFSQD